MKILSGLFTLTLLCTAFTLGACVSSIEYMGIPLDSPENSAGISDDIRNLAAYARAGDKRAQLDLGIAFEEGRGVKQDLNKALTLYRFAATTSGGTTWVYSPPVGSAAGRVIPINRGPVQTGLLEAKARLERLENMATMTRGEE